MNSSVTAGDGVFACAGGGGGAFFWAETDTVNKSARAAAKRNLGDDMFLTLAPFRLNG
jgi:hypothetical protein